MVKSDFEKIIGLINEPEERIKVLISSLERNLISDEYLDEVLKYSLKNKNLYRFGRIIINFSKDANKFSRIANYLESAGEFFVSGDKERYSINLELFAGFNNLEDRVYACVIYEIAARISLFNKQERRGIDNYLKAQNIATSLELFDVAKRYGEIMKSLLNN